jgi:transposase InsO family protein
MPWRDTVVEDVRRSFCEEVLASSRSMSRLCRVFGVSRKTGYKWLRRYRQAGQDGLSDRRRQPHYRPGRASAVLEALVLDLKQQHPYWGPRKLHHLVYEDHPEAERVGISTFARILTRHHLVIPRERPVVHPAVGRFERGEPNELWQLDMKMAMRLPDGTKRYVAGILDDHSRFALGLWWLPDVTDRSVLACWIDAANRYGLPLQTLTDHGSQFRMEDHTTSAFRTYLWACGVDHTQGRVGHPQTQGKIERFWSTFQRELTPQLVCAEPSHWPELMERWRVQYNTRRPHEALDDRPPVSRYRPSQRSFTEPDRHARIGQAQSIYRQVSIKGEISLGGRPATIGRGLYGWIVEVRPLGNGCWHVYFRGHFLREFMLTKPLRSVTHVPAQV